jgi:predicted dehydrogenase
MFRWTRSGGVAVLLRPVVARHLAAVRAAACTLNHAVHHIDLLNWMMGLPREVTSVIANLAHGQRRWWRDLSVSILRYDHAVGQVTGSVCPPRRSPTDCFSGRKGAGILSF